jgi:hypothetical protein
MLHLEGDSPHLTFRENQRVYTRAHPYVRGATLGNGLLKRWECDEPWPLSP